MVVQIDLLKITERYPEFCRTVARPVVMPTGEGLVVRLTDHSAAADYSKTLWRLYLSAESIDGRAGDRVQPTAWEHDHHTAVYRDLPDGVYGVPEARNWNSLYGDLVIRVAEGRATLLDRNTDPDRDRKVDDLLAAQRREEV